MAKQLMRHTLLSALVLGGLLAAAPAWSVVDDMPPPKKAPRIKVQQQKLAVEEGRGNRIVSGLAHAIDAERIKVGDTELRLFGVTIPPMGSPHGNEAHGALEKLFANETVTCRIQERDKSFRLLASCKTDKISDISQTLLQEGWAYVARSTVEDTNYADLYFAAQSKAQLQKLGMWSEGKEAAKTETVAEAKAAEAKPAEGKTGENKPDETKLAATGEKPVLSTTSGSNTKNDKVAEKPAGVESDSSKATAESSAQLQVPTMLPPEVVTTTVQSSEPSTAWLWFAGMTPAAVMILYGLGQIALRRYEYSQERKALAAALRGELMAARAICISRADTLGYGSEAVSKLSSVWPRLRSTLYQAYVNRIGLLGPDLARRVSSLYGQFADYAQFYATKPNAEAAGKIDNGTVQQTLFTIIDHIEDTLNNLQQVEVSGKAPKRLLPQRQNINTPRTSQRLAEKAAEKMDYVEAELVEDAMAIKSVITPARIAAQSSARAEAAAKPAPESKEAAPSKVIATFMKQDAAANLTEETLANITAAHDAMKAEEEAAPASKSAPPATIGDEEETALDKTVSAEPAAKTESDKAETETAAPTSRQRRRRARPEAKPEDKAEEAVAEGEVKEEYYDFRSQAVRIAK